MFESCYLYHLLGEFVATDNQRDGSSSKHGDLECSGDLEQSFTKCSAANFEAVGIFVSVAARRMGFAGIRAGWKEIQQTSRARIVSQLRYRRRSCGLWWFDAGACTHVARSTKRNAGCQHYREERFGDSDDTGDGEHRELKIVQPVRCRGAIAFRLRLERLRSFQERRRLRHSKFSGCDRSGA